MPASSEKPTNVPPANVANAGNGTPLRFPQHHEPCGHNRSRPTTTATTSCAASGPAALTVTPAASPSSLHDTPASETAPLALVNGSCTVTRGSSSTSNRCGDTPE